MTSILFTFMMFLAGCVAPQQYEHGGLIQQLLRPHRDYPGFLVNQVCRGYEGSKCIKWDLEKYDLKSETDRIRLNNVKLECNLAGRRYGACLDRPGYCSREMRVKKFLGIVIKKEFVVVDYIPAVESHQRLVDAVMKCMAQDLVR